MRIQDYTRKGASRSPNSLHTGFLLGLAIVAFITQL